MRLLAITLSFFLVLIFLGEEKSFAQERIGVVLPLSGGTQVWGEGIRRGLELAEKSYPQSFNFIFEDEGFCDSKRALTAAKKLLDADRVKILITGCLNGTKVIQPVAARKGALVLSAGLLDAESIEQFNNVVSLSAQIGTEAERLSQFIEQVGHKKLAVFRHDDTFTHEFITQLRRGLKKDPEISVHDVPVVDASFPWKSELARSKKEGYEAYILYLGDDELVSFMKAKKGLQDRTPLLSGYIIESNFDEKRFGDILDGIIFTYPALAESNTTQRMTFEELFAGVFGVGVRPTVNTYFVYDGMRVLSSALKSCEEQKRSCLHDFFTENSKTWAGVSGKFSYNADGSIAREFLLKKVQGTSFLPWTG